MNHFTETHIVAKPQWVKHWKSYQRYFVFHFAYIQQFNEYSINLKQPMNNHKPCKYRSSYKAKSYVNNIFILNKWWSLECGNTNNKCIYITFQGFNGMGWIFKGVWQISFPEGRGNMSELPFCQLMSAPEIKTYYNQSLPIFTRI